MTITPPTRHQVRVVLPASLASPVATQQSRYSGGDCMSRWNWVMDVLWWILAIAVPLAMAVLLVVGGPEAR